MNESCIASRLAIAVSKDNRKCHCCCDQLLTTVAATTLSIRPTLGHAHTQLTTQRGENTEAGQVGRWRDSATHSSTLQCPETPPPPWRPPRHTHTRTRYRSPGAGGPPGGHARFGSGRNRLRDGGRLSPHKAAAKARTARASEAARQPGGRQMGTWRRTGGRQPAGKLCFPVAAAAQ